MGKAQLMFNDLIKRIHLYKHKQSDWATHFTNTLKHHSVIH